MRGENGTPPTPDWTPHAGNLCAGCQGGINLCDVLRAVDGNNCCDQCSHTVDSTTSEALLYEGDQA